MILYEKMSIFVSAKKDVDDMRLSNRFFYGLLVTVALLAAGCSKESADPVPEPGAEGQLAENPKVKAAVKTMVSAAAKTEATLNAVDIEIASCSVPQGEWKNVFRMVPKK